MEKDLSFLKENKLFLWLCSCLPIAFIGVMEYLLFPAYTTWILWKIVVLAVAIGLSTIAYSVWLSINVFNKPTIKKTIVFTAVFTTLVCFFNFGASAIDLAIKQNNVSAYVLGVGTADIILILSFVYGWMKSEKTSARAATAATVALCAALIIVLSVFVSFLPKKEDSFNASVVKEFETLDTLPAGKGKHVKVILLNGQSNASGCSRVAYLSAEDQARYQNGFDNVRINYFCDNGFNRSYGAFVPVRSKQGFSAGGGLIMGEEGFFGPELGLGETLSSVNEDFIILKYTWGGTILATQWFAPQDNGSEGALYRAFINFTKTHMDYLRSRGYVAEIGAMCWMQGESDSVNEDWTASYLQNTKDFVSSLRRDLAEYAAPDGIRYIDAGISDSPYWERYTRVNDAKKTFAADPNNNAVYIDTIAEGLNYKVEPEAQPDLAHYDSYSEIKLGHLFGQKVLERYALLP